MQFLVNFWQTNLQYLFISFDNYSIKDMAAYTGENKVLHALFCSHGIWTCGCNDWWCKAKKLGSRAKFMKAKPSLDTFTAKMRPTPSPTVSNCFTTNCQSVTCKQRLYFVGHSLQRTTRNRERHSYCRWHLNRHCCDYLCLLASISGGFFG